MKKTLIALSLLSVSGLAMADVVLYGQIRGGVEVTAGQKAAGAKVKGTTTALKDFGSRIGFKGQEALGSGDLKAIWQLEQAVRIDGSAGRGFGTRDSFIGLEGGFGKVRVGHITTPLEMAGDLNYLWTGTGDVIDDFSDAYKRAVSIDYTTPNFGGFQARVNVSPSDNNNGGTNVNAPNGRDAAIYGTSLSYKHDAGFFAGLAGGYVKNGASNRDYDVNGKPKDAYQAYTQAGFDNGTILAGLGYKYSRNVDTHPLTSQAVHRSQDALAAFNYTFNDSLRLNTAVGYGWDYRDVSKQKILGNGKYLTAGVGLDYFLSKRTEVKTGYGYHQAGSKAQRYSGHTASVALRHRF